MSLPSPILVMGYKVCPVSHPISHYALPPSASPGTSRGSDEVSSGVLRSFYGFPIFSSRTHRLIRTFFQSSGSFLLRSSSGFRLFFFDLQFTHFPPLSFFSPLEHEFSATFHLFLSRDLTSFFSSPRTRGVGTVLLLHTHLRLLSIFRLLCLCR